ncbi:hypothetical protein ACP70R_036427 [Stipagrostis hirtigluma subsp. patula]
MASQTSSRCDACGGGMGLRQAAFTSECGHTFHLRCVSGSAACPVCTAPWRDTPAAAPAPAPATPVSFPSPPPSSPPSPAGLLGQAPATTNPFWLDSVPPHDSQSSLNQQTNSFVRPPQYGPYYPPPPMPFQSRLVLPVFDDDEPVEPPLSGRDTVQEAASNNGELVLKTHCEHPAVARDTARDNFVVLVHAKAPAAAAEASARAPLDLVTVLDVSGSMDGSKLVLLKQAMEFVIDNLGPGDRLSIVTFSCTARRVIRLTRMSDGGKASAKGAVESLYADGSTNIRDGLRVAADVLDGRRHRNAVASIILLSDGQDNQTMHGHGYGYGYSPYGRSRSSNYSDLVPRSLRRTAGTRCTPVHTFGFGMDHDAAAMHAIAEVTGGTFSFIQNQAVVQDSFAQCIGGLLSVAVQEARVAVECLHPGVRIWSLKSGRYERRISADGRTASVDSGELYADEERCFLLFVDVPSAAGDDAEDGGVTRLIKVNCTYRDAATGRSVNVAGDDAVVQRPEEVVDVEPSVEVARERFRVEVAEDIAAARAAAERGQHAEAARILDRRQQASATAGLAGDARCEALVAELRELSARVADRREYEQSGRACLLAGMSSHAQQRAATVQLFGSAAPCSSYGGLGAAPGASLPVCGAPPPSYGSAMPMQPAMAAAPSFAAGYGGAPRFGAGYVTPTMQNMVESSRKRREQRW